MEGKSDKPDMITSFKPSMGTDDFSYYLDKVPGLYLRIGGAGEGTLHSGDLQLNEDLLNPAIKHLAEFISSLLGSQ